MPWRTMRCAGQPEVFVPLITTSPPAIGTIPEIAFRQVDLPLPLGPRRATASPSASTKSTPRRISRAPYETRRPLTLSSDSAMTQIRLEHGEVGADRCRRALGDLDTAVEHGHDIGCSHDEVDGMLDQQHGDAHLPGEAPDELDELRAHRRREPHRRLVE